MENFKYVHGLPFGKNKYLPITYTPYCIKETEYYAAVVLYLS